MAALDDIQQALREQPQKPPIERWHPPLSGDIDIRIDRRGDWYHEGVRIARKPLVKLFASILRREQDGEYYLITPVEKWRIHVDETPLVAVDMDVISEPEQKIIFRLNTDDLITLDSPHPLVINGNKENPIPVLMLDRGLSAKLTTSVYYRLVELIEVRGGESGIHSCGEWFLCG